MLLPPCCCYCYCCVLLSPAHMPWVSSLHLRDYLIVIALLLLLNLPPLLFVRTGITLIRCYYCDLFCWCYYIRLLLERCTDCLLIVPCFPICWWTFTFTDLFCWLLLLGYLGRYIIVIWLLLLVTRWYYGVTDDWVFIVVIVICNWYCWYC